MMKGASVHEAMEHESFESGDDDEEGSTTNGWPFGLAPMNARLSDVATAAGTSASPLSSCTPTSPSSSSSSSSSAFDSESTTSFFPEKSRSLGTLIGIHSSSQFMLSQNDCLEDRNTGKSGRNRFLRSLLGCGRGHREDSLNVSPSLSHYLERQGTLQSFQNSILEDRGESSNINEDATHIDVCFHNEDWRRSQSCGTSLQLILQQPRPESPSSAFGNLSTRHSIRNDHSPLGSRILNLCLIFCGKLSTSIATSGM